MKRLQTHGLLIGTIIGIIAGMALGAGVTMGRARRAEAQVAVIRQKLADEVKYSDLLYDQGVLAKTYEVIRVIDGDTFDVKDCNGVQVRVRLREGDAPEKGEDGYEAATRALAEQIEGKRVYLTPYARDKYGRCVALVSANGEPVNFRP